VTCSACINHPVAHCHLLQLSNHLKECRKLLKKPNLEYITVAQEDYLMEVVSAVLRMVGATCAVLRRWHACFQRISECKVVPADWLRINSTKTVYRYRSPRTQSLKEEREQAVERLAAEAERAFGDLLSMVSLKYEAFRDGEYSH
jgi:DNA mismatch repair protein MSH3